MSAPQIPEVAERLFSRVFRLITQRHDDVKTFRKLAGLGQQAAVGTVSAQNYAFALSILHDPKFDEFFLDRKAAVSLLGGPEALGAQMTGKQLSLFNAAVDAASLVFIHSAVDAAVSDLCRVTYLLQPERWRRFIETQKVTLAEVQSNNVDELWASKLEAHLAALERESLKKRADRLFAICEPPPSFDPIGNFKYDSVAMERLDQLRQDIIHGAGPTTIPDCDAEIEYLVKIGLYFFSMVNATFGIRVNPLAAMGLTFPVAQGSGGSK